MRELFIKEQRDFNRIIKSGKQLNTPIGRLKITKNGAKTPKLGIIIGKTQGLTAVKRNRIRRAIKEAWRSIPVAMFEPVEVVIFPRNHIFVEKSTKIALILSRAIGDAGVKRASC